ncbi:PC-esterase domain-containing protein 1A-like isoform X3 [Dendropsophus ebraccatus]|uniref:PC-esterase domain-containing protein 1A-like isoform X3 n=1 Tax=Dendropsophus ebraccatus TaxID=150705 RepID=UPI00383206A5
MGWFRSAEMRQLLHNKFVVVLGDSIQRSVYKDFVKLLREDSLLSDVQIKDKGELGFENDTLVEGGKRGEMHNRPTFREVRQYRTGHHLVRFYFLTRAYSDYLESVLSDFQSGPQPDVVIVNSCVWDLMSRCNPNALETYKTNVDILFQRLKEVLNPKCLIIWTLTMPVGYKDHEIPENIRHNLRWDIVEANFFSATIAHSHKLDVLDMHHHFLGNLHFRCKDSIHWNQLAHRKYTQILLTHIAESWGVEVPRSSMPEGFMAHLAPPHPVAPGSDPYPRPYSTMQEQDYPNQAPFPYVPVPDIFLTAVIASSFLPSFPGPLPFVPVQNNTIAPGFFRSPPDFPGRCAPPHPYPGPHPPFQERDHPNQDFPGRCAPPHPYPGPHPPFQERDHPNQDFPGRCAPPHPYPGPHPPFQERDHPNQGFPGPFAPPHPMAMRGDPYPGPRPTIHERDHPNQGFPGHFPRFHLSTFKRTPRPGPYPSIQERERPAWASSTCVTDNQLQPPTTEPDPLPPPPDSPRRSLLPHPMAMRRDPDPGPHPTIQERDHPNQDSPRRSLLPHPMAMRRDPDPGPNPTIQERDHPNQASSTCVTDNQLQPPTTEPDPLPPPPGSPGHSSPPPPVAARRDPDPMPNPEVQEQEYWNEGAEYVRGYFSFDGSDIDNAPTPSSFVSDSLLLPAAETPRYVPLWRGPPRWLMVPMRSRIRRKRRR